MECTLIITHWLTYCYIIKVEDSTLCGPDSSTDRVLDW